MADIRGFCPPDMWGADQMDCFSQAVVQPEGRVLHVTGQVAWDRDSNVVGLGDAGKQTRKCVENIEEILSHYGGRLDDIVSLSFFFLNREDIPAIREVRGELLTYPAGLAPISVFIQVSGLVLPEFLIEIAPVAVIPHARFRDPNA